MLYLARSLSRLHFSSLMAVYAESNRENGREFWPEEPEMRQIQLAEEDFYRYLSQVFFRSPGAVYAVWEENGRYVSEQSGMRSRSEVTSVRRMDSSPMLSKP